MAKDQILCKYPCSGCEWQTTKKNRRHFIVNLNKSDHIIETISSHNGSHTQSKFERLTTTMTTKEKKETRKCIHASYLLFAMWTVKQDIQKRFVFPFLSLSLSLTNKSLMISDEWCNNKRGANNVNEWNVQSQVQIYFIQ